MKSLYIALWMKEIFIMPSRNPLRLDFGFMCAQKYNKVGRMGMRDGPCCGLACKVC